MRPAALATAPPLAGLSLRTVVRYAATPPSTLRPRKSNATDAQATNKRSVANDAPENRGSAAATAVGVVGPRLGCTRLSDAPGQRRRSVCGRRQPRPDGAAPRPETHRARRTIVLRRKPAPRRRRHFPPLRPQGAARPLPPGSPR